MKNKQHTRKQIQEVMDKQQKKLDEWDDTHIPRGRVGHHATGKPKKYWVAIGDDILINNYSEFVNQSLQLKPLTNNASPTFSTTDPNAIKNLAKRCIIKFPGKYIFVGVDDSSLGMVTRKNHLRASIRYYWDPVIKSWNDADMNDSEKIDEASYGGEHGYSDSNLEPPTQEAYYDSLLNMSDEQNAETLIELFNDFDEKSLKRLLVNLDDQAMLTDFLRDLVGSMSSEDYKKYIKALF